jgi:hypothetical protein
MHNRKESKKNQNVRKITNQKDVFFDLHKSPMKNPHFLWNSKDKKTIKETITKLYFYRFSFGKQPSMQVQSQNTKAHTFQIKIHLSLMLNLNTANNASLA